MDQNTLIICSVIIGVALMFLLRPASKRAIASFDMAVPRMEVVEIGPDDVIVITCPKLLSKQQADAIREHWSEGVKIGKKVIVLDGGLGIEVLRPERTEVIEFSNNNEASDYNGDHVHTWIDVTSLSSPKKTREFKCRDCAATKTEPM